MEGWRLWGGDGDGLVRAGWRGVSRRCCLAGQEKLH